MVTPSHITRGIALINLDNPANKVSPQLLAEDGNIYQIPSQNEPEANKHRTTNNFLSNHFLKIWKLNTPKMAAIHAPPSIFRGASKRSILPKSPITSGKICFGFNIQKTEIIFNPLMDDVHYWSYKAFSSPLDFLKLALFDGWVGNNGRKNPSKDLFFLPDKNKKLELYSKNHAYTFGDISYNFLSKNYRTKAHFSIVDLNIVRKIINMYAFEELRNMLSIYYNNSIKMVLTSIEEILKEIPEDYVIGTKNRNKIVEFLANNDKNDRVLNEFLVLIKP